MNNRLKTADFKGTVNVFPSDHIVLKNNLKENPQLEIYQLSDKYR